jgi:hypothetical protein
MPCMQSCAALAGGVHDGVAVFGGGLLVVLAVCTVRGVQQPRREAGAIAIAYRPASAHRYA